MMGWMGQTKALFVKLPDQKFLGIAIRRLVQRLVLAEQQGEKDRWQINERPEEQPSRHSIRWFEREPYGVQKKDQADE